MAMSYPTLHRAMIEGLGVVLERIGEVQGVPGEEEVADYAEFDGSEFPPIDPDSVVVHEREGQAPSISFNMASGEHRIELSLTVSPPWPSST